MRIPYRYAVALTAALGLFMAVLDNTIVNVALTAMQKSFNTDINTIQWVITAYFLAQAAVIPAAGYLANRFGLKELFILALAIFTIGSLLCGLSPRFGAAGGDTLLVAFRVLQGIGGGMLFPLATSIALGAFPPAERAAATGLVAVPVLLAPTLGPTVGGLLIDSGIGWPGIFYINIPVGIVAILLIARIYRPEVAAAGPGAGPAAAPARRERFDWVGLILSMVGVLLVVYAFVLVSETRPGTISAANPRGDIYGWGYGPVYALLGAGLAILAAFAFYELRVARDPVLDLRLFTSYNFTIATVLTWITRAVVLGSFFLVPLFLEQFQGYSAVRTGLILLPQGLAAGIAIAIGSRLYDRIGPRAVVTLGMILLTVSSLMLIGVDRDSRAAFFIPILLIRGAGFGFSNLPLQTLALSAITGRALPKASSLYNATAQVFSSIGVAVLSTLFIQGTKTHATDLAGAAQASGTAPPADLALQAGAGGMGDAFLFVTIATAAALLLGLFLPSRGFKQEQEREAREAAQDGSAPERRPSLAAE